MGAHPHPHHEEVKVVSSETNTIAVPVVAQLRNPGSSVVATQTAKRTHAEVTDAMLKPSPGDSSRAERGSEQPSREVIERALARLNELSNSQKRRLNFSYDDRIEKVVVRILEGDSEKLVRQIPPEEMIRLSLKIDEAIGVLFNQNV
jgi:flagellar protein FlaG